MIPSESTLERDWLILQDFDQSVERCEEQPVKIEYYDEQGRRRFYTPDLLIIYNDGKPPLLCEVKYAEDLRKKWKEMKPKIKAGRRYARERGWKFRIFTERRIRTPFLTNVKFLRHQQCSAPSQENQDVVLNKLRRMRKATPQRLIESIHRDPLKRAEVLPIVWYLVASQRILADLSQPLTMNTPIKTESH